MERKRLTTLATGLALLAVVGTGGYAAAQTTDMPAGAFEVVRAAEPGPSRPGDQIIAADSPRIEEQPASPPTGSDTAE